jgi:UDP-N-acetylglucosamine 2-epimerase (non-hydrolysing)
MKKVSLIFGTRPEAIKLYPLVLAMKEDPDLEPHICVTGQHREMLEQVLDVFGVAPDVNLTLMEPNQTLARLTSNAVAKIDQYLEEYRPDMAIVQGDTTTAFCAALAAFYHQIPVGHVEAGLRTWNKFSPFPEEINRILISHMADIHFAPTKTSRENLLRECIPQERVIVTGNTVIDALFLAVEKIKEFPPCINELPEALQPAAAGSDAPKIVLITGHRRENFGQGFENICHAIAELARRFPSVHFVYPVHLNPNVREPVGRILGESAIQNLQHATDPSNTVDNIHLIEPLPYLGFVAMMNRSHILLTDSGGVQEEAPSLGKPVLVMRDTTERPEAVEMGTVKIVGTDMEAIVQNVVMLLTQKNAYNAMANAVNPYGDGKATARILTACKQFLVGRMRNT